MKVTYDPTHLSYADLLSYFMRHIDPTDNGGQFCDRGAAYRPAIFVEGTSEKSTAEKVITDAKEILKQDIKVDVLQVAPFWVAEDYHQNYAEKNPTRYKFYRWKCGRDQRVEALWGDK